MVTTMRSCAHRGLSYLTFPILDVYSSHLIHAVSLRVGGVSASPYYSLNLGLHVGDEPGCVVRNRRLLCESIGIGFDSLTVGEQVHGSRVSVVRAVDKGRGSRSLTDALVETDALITATPGIALMVLVADCPAILVYEPRNRVVGVVHAGWKGTLNRVVVAAIERMSRECDVSPSTMVAAIGPAIGPCCYSISEERAAEFLSTFGSHDNEYIRHDRRGQAYLDLWELNRLQLVESGIPPSAVYVSRLCTACNANLFFSHRGEHGTTGRFGVVVCLR